MSPLYVVLCLPGSESSMGRGKMRVCCRKGGLPRVHTDGVEKMEETFVQRGTLFKDIYPLFWKYSEKMLLEGEVSLVVSIVGFLRERFPWKVPFFEGKGNRTVHFSSGRWSVLGSTYSVSWMLWERALWERIAL